jgi:diguanylate cyclase (GGDEF)-like protein
VTRGNLDLADRILLIAGTVVTTALSLVRFVGAVREQARVQNVLAHQADHDTLTGLANRRAFTSRLRQHRPADCLTVIYIDLDRFKPINDTYGHAAGDAVLVAVAERLRNAVRPGDLAARLGGDEFAALCADLDPAGQHHLTDRLAAVIAEPIDVDGGHRVTVGASIGVASTRDGIEPQTLITRADHAMFDAKHNGYGRVVAPV